ncbi:MAG: winged helix-turn-helix domain-containing protein [Actinomycetota bacterium]
MTLIETNFATRADQSRRDTDDRSAHPDNDTVPRALVTLVHNSDRRSVEAALQMQGYLVRSTNDPTAADVLLRAFEPDIVIVDARDAYPTFNNQLAQVRRCPEIYLVVVGANSDDQRATVLRNGADDAVPTDVSADELVQRCQAMLRRPRPKNGVSATLDAKVLYFGPLMVDLARREIKVNRHPIAATRLEFDLFAQLCLKPLEVCSRTQLLESVWGPHWVGDTHVVDVHLSNLRRKLNERAPEVRFMHTVRGIGFRLADDLLRLASHDLASSRLLDAHSLQSRIA